MFKLYVGYNKIVRAQFRKQKDFYQVIVPEGMSLPVERDEFEKNYRELTLRELDLIAQTNPESQISAISDGGEQYTPPGVNCNETPLYNRHK